MKVADLAFMGHKDLQESVVATMVGLGVNADAPSLIHWDGDEPTIYVADDGGIWKLERKETSRRMFAVDGKLIPWDQARGAGLGFSSFVDAPGPGTVMFRMDHPEIHESATHDEAAQKALTDFGQHCVRQRARFPR